MSEISKIERHGKGESGMSDLQLSWRAKSALERIGSGAILVRTSSDTDEAVTRGGGFLYSLEPGGRKFPTASGRELIESGAVEPRGDGLLPEVSQTFVRSAS